MPKKKKDIVAEPVQIEEPTDSTIYTLHSHAFFGEVKTGEEGITVRQPLIVTFDNQDYPIEHFTITGTAEEIVVQLITTMASHLAAIVTGAGQLTEADIKNAKLTIARNIQAKLVGETKPQAAEGVQKIAPKTKRTNKKINKITI